MMRYLLSAVVAFLLAGQLSATWGANKQEERLAKSAEVFQQIMDTPDQGIPVDLLARAAVLPQTIVDGPFVIRSCDMV